MMDYKTLKQPNAWIAINHGFGTDHRLGPYVLILKGERSLYQSIVGDDWVLTLNLAGSITRVGRVLRVRSDLETTTLYFDQVLSITQPVLIGLTSLTPPSSGSIGRVQWADFVEALTKALNTTIAEIPTVGSNASSPRYQQELAYIRELLQLAVMDDLLGPAGGPHERIVDMGVRDRYLVGKLAPRDAEQGGIEGLEGPLANDDAEEPSDPKAPGQHEPGAEFGTATGRLEPESGDADEIDAASNQSLVPSSLGMTFCVDGDADRIEVEVRWGRYERSDEHEIFRTHKNKETGAETQTKAKVWQRIPCGGKLVLPLIEGVIPHWAPHEAYPDVRIQGSVRTKNVNGDRLVTLFLVNAQQELETNRDSAWLFQPELIVRSEAEAPKRAIFRRKPVLDADGMDHGSAHHRHAAVRSASHRDAGAGFRRQAGHEGNGEQWPARHAAPRDLGHWSACKCAEPIDQGLRRVDQ
jgi:hypothetical protein